MPRGVWTPKQERMYEHVKESTGDKHIAAATVNKYRAKHGMTKKKTKKGVDIDGLGARATVGKAVFNTETDRVKRVGTPPPMHKRQRQRPPKSAAAQPGWWGGYEKEETSMAMSERRLKKLAKSIVAKSYGADASVGDWSEKFRGTKLFDAAVKLREDELDLEIKHLEENKKRQMKQPDPFWEKLDSLRLKKEKLTLQLLKMKLRGDDKEKTMKSNKSKDSVAKSLEGLGGFADLFKADNDEPEAASEQNEVEDDDDVADDEVEKGEDDEEGEDVDQDELAADDAEGDEDEPDETNKSEGEDEGEDVIACPHCASDITADEVRAQIAKSKGVGGSPKGHQKQGKAIPDRTAGKESQHAFSAGEKNRNGKPGNRRTEPSRGAKGVARQNPAGNVGSYKGKHGGQKGASSMPMHKGGENQNAGKSPFGPSPLITLSKSTGVGSDEEIAREIARMSGADYDKIGQ